MCNHTMRDVFRATSGLRTVEDFVTAKGDTLNHRPRNGRRYGRLLTTESALERTRPAMTWHIGSANGRPVIRWVMLPAQSSMVIDER